MVNGLEDDLSEVNSQLAQNALQKQSYKSVFDSIKNKNDDNIIVKKNSEDRITTFINHGGSRYQAWRLTREAYAFDSNVPVNTNGDVFVLDNIYNTRLVSVFDVEETSADIVQVGTWATSSGKIYSATTGEYLEFKFFGTGIYISLAKLTNAGVAKITIDGRSDLVVGYSDGLIDTYGSSGYVAVWLSETLDYGEHTVRVTVNGTKNELSSDYRVYFDKFRIVTLIDTSQPSTILYSELNMVDGATKVFRPSSTAVELAINNTYNNNAVWSGFFHRNNYPKSIEMFLDGKAYSSAIGEYQIGKEFVIHQTIALLNGQTEIAEVDCTVCFRTGGCEVTTKITWKEIVSITNSYTAMFSSLVDKALIGTNPEIITLAHDESETNRYKTNNVLVWNTLNNYAFYFEVLDYLNTTANDFSESGQDGVYIWDRAQEQKIYVSGKIGLTSVGEVWRNKFKIELTHVNNITKRLF